MVYLWKEYFSKGFFIFWIYILLIVMLFFCFWIFVLLIVSFYFVFQCSSLWLRTMFSTFECLSLWVRVYLHFLDLSIFEVCVNVFEVYLSFFQSINLWGLSIFWDLSIHLWKGVESMWVKSLKAPLEWWSMEHHGNMEEWPTIKPI